jgi:hypothetical protein
MVQVGFNRRPPVGLEHALNTDPKVKPKLQRQRPMSGDRVKSAEAEVQKLLDARIIREVQYPFGWPMW